MDALSTVSFPTDRSLVGLPARQATVSVTLDPFAPTLSSRPTAELIAFAALFVHSRLLQQEAVQARLLMDDGAQAESLVEACFTADATLTDALQTVRIDPHGDEAQTDLTIQPQGLGPDSNGTDNVLTFACDANDLRLSLTFDAATLSSLSARDFLEKVGLVLRQLGIAPDTRCSDLVLLTSVARPLFPDLTKEIPAVSHEYIPEVFFRIAAQHLHDPAIASDTSIYTYAELSRTVSHLANQLVAAGLAVGETVAVDGFSSFGVLASLIAVLAAGGVVVTLDQALPEERRTLIADLSRARLRILVRPSGKSGPAGADTIATVDWPSRSDLDALPVEAPPSPQLPVDASAYIFFTSGSTGVPKGVLGTHLGLAHFLAWQRAGFQIGRGDHTAQLTALSFDVVLRDVLFPLTSGACVHIPRRDMLFDARRMLKWIGETGVTAMHCVPSLMKAWLLADTGNHPFRSLRYIFFAGEPLTDTLLTRFVAAAGADTRIINLYGPTETTLAKLANPINDIEAGVQPVGNPLPGTEVAIIRDRRVPCGLWEIGEIAIRTPYRSKGYVGNEALTRQVFVANSFRNDPNDLIYYTGDLGRYRSDGKIEIFGRIDAQIKIRGVRIEPNEIEAQLLKFPGIRDAAITTRIAGNAEKVLVGLVVPEAPVASADQTAFSRRICDFLKQKLPEPMVPTRVFALVRLPYLPNGKLDRKAISAMQLDLQGGEPPAALRSANLDDRTQRIITGFEETLGHRITSLNESFVNLGGDSLSYIRLSMIIEDQLGWLPSDWEKRPLAELARLASPTGAAPPGSWWTRLDSTVLFRAISIFIVALSHTKSYALLESTSTLFVISGMNFSKFLRPGIRDTGRLGPTLRFIARFAIPAGLWEAMRGFAFHQFWLPDLFLLGTFFKNPHAHYTFWFLDVLAANVLILAVATGLGFRLRGRQRVEDSGRTSSFWTDLLWCLGGLGIAVAQVSSGWWDGDVGTTSVAPFKWLWMVAFGILMTQANTVTRKCLVTGLLGLLALTACSGLRDAVLVFGNSFPYFFFTSVLLLIWLERVPVPRLLQRPVVGIASATLFIYIVNYTVINRLLPHLGLPAWWPVQVGAAMMTGIVAKLAWNRLTTWVDHTLTYSKQRISAGIRWLQKSLPHKPGPHFSHGSGASGL
ncbi:MAG TPA: amino acid adenylation domain-containing protein [Rhodopila sp.]|nr:amino acid adenylation domain-containing protein [Rhodopila sp.]